MSSNNFDSEKASNLDHAAEESSSSSKRQKIDKEIFEGLEYFIPTASDGIPPTGQGSNPGGLDDVVDPDIMPMPLVASRRANLPPVRTYFPPDQTRKRKAKPTNTTTHFFKPKPIDTYEVMIGEVNGERGHWTFGVEQKRRLTAELDHMRKELVLKLDDDNDMHYKMEIKWNHISSLTVVENQDTTQSMKLELHSPPTLWCENTKSVRLSWIEGDFTGWVALNNRIVDVKFYPGELGDFLADCEDLSNMRNGVAFPSLPSRYF